MVLELVTHLPWSLEVPLEEMTCFRPPGHSGPGLQVWCVEGSVDTGLFSFPITPSRESVQEAEGPAFPCQGNDL